MVYTVTFNPALDYIINVDKLSLNTIVRTSSTDYYPGGKGVNVSNVLASLGIENVALGFVGGFVGYEYCKLANSIIKTDFVNVDNGNTRINVKIKDSKDVELGVNADGFLLENKDIDKLMTKLNNAKMGDYVCLSGSVQSNVNKDIYAKIISSVDKTVKFVIDATGELLLKSLVGKPYLIKPNNDELSEIFGVEISTQEDIIKYAQKLQKLGASNVLVSRGEKGAILVTNDNQIIVMESIKGDVVSTVGAGDSMVAGFIAGIMRFNNVKQALKLSVAAGAATAFCYGIASSKQIETVYNKIK